jgi:hypothetical protein
MVVVQHMQERKGKENAARENRARAGATQSTATPTATRSFKSFQSSQISTRTKLLPQAGQMATSLTRNIIWQIKKFKVHYLSNN